MALFTVIWRDCGDDFMVTSVEVEDSINPHTISNNEWAARAHRAELEDNNVAPEESMFDPEEDGYDLITVFRGVPEFIY